MTATQRFLRGNVFAGASVIALLSPLASPMRASAGAEDGPAGPAAEELASARGAIEKAFAQAAAPPLRPVLPRRLKTYVSLGILGVAEGYYGADQMLLLFGRLFDGRTTVRFVGLDPAARPRDGQVLLPFRWIYREEGSPQSEARISFTLAPEGVAWRIREIRDLK